MSGAAILTELRKLLEIREKDEKAYQEHKRLRAERNSQQALVYELMEDSGMRSNEFDLGEPWGVVRFTPQSRVSGTVFDEDLAFEAFKREGLLDQLTKPTERKAVLNELVRDRLENGQPLPDGVSFYSTDYVQVKRKG